MVGSRQQPARAASLASLVGRTMVLNMSSDAGDRGINTDELPLFVASGSQRVLGDVGTVYSGRARPVVMSDSQLALRMEPDYDATVIPQRFLRPPPVSVAETGPERLPGRRIDVVVSFVIFAVLAMLVAALMIALAVR